MQMDQDSGQKPSRRRKVSHQQHPPQADPSLGRRLPALGQPGAVASTPTLGQSKPKPGPKPGKATPLGASASLAGPVSQRRPTGCASGHFGFRLGAAAVPSLNLDCSAGTQERRTSACSTSSSATSSTASTAHSGSSSQFSAPASAGASSPPTPASSSSPSIPSSLLSTCTSPPTPLSPASASASFSALSSSSLFTKLPLPDPATKTSRPVSLLSESRDRLLFPDCSEIDSVPFSFQAKASSSTDPNHCDNVPRDDFDTVMTTGAMDRSRQDSFVGSSAKPISMANAARRESINRNRRESLAGSLMGGMSWGGMSFGSFVRDE